MRVRSTDRQKPRVWSQTDLQAECSRPLLLTEERYASAQGCREKTSKPCPRDRYCARYWPQNQLCLGVDGLTLKD
jgi:hypothetical protein